MDLYLTRNIPVSLCLCGETNPCYTSSPWGGGRKVYGYNGKTKNHRNVSIFGGFRCFTLLMCGETGIRTLGPLARSTVFETAPFDRSGISPCIA
jgi:hypothetical protein